MNHTQAVGGGNRRDFLKRAAGTAGAFLVAGSCDGLLAKIAPNWKKQIGLELYTVRDLLAKDFEGTIAKVAEIGYKEVEPVGFGGLDPKAFRALLDRYKLTAPSTHTSASDGPNLEKQLEGHQVMGFKYTEIRAAAPPRPPAPPAAKDAAKDAAKKAPAGQRPAVTLEAAKRSAAQMNKHGAVAKKFGMKLLYHNHGFEFDKLADSEQCQYDIFLAETDPKLVTMQIDIAWATIAGKNVLDMFKKHPGRYELWHVKDATGLKSIDPNARPGQRRVPFIPVGHGEIDYKPIFAQAKLAGLKYFVIEQDNAGDKGADSMAAARANYQGLLKVLS